MPCTAELTRWEDKYTIYENAVEDANEAANLVLAADAAMVVSCGTALYTGGGFGFTAAACIAALAALATAVAKLETARDKRRIAGEASNRAYEHYQDCISKCRR